MVNLVFPQKLMKKPVIFTVAKRYAIIPYIRSSLKDSGRELRSRLRPGEKGRLKIISEGRALTL